jgi:hypothetical protein
MSVVAAPTATIGSHGNAAVSRFAMDKLILALVRVGEL